MNDFGFKNSSLFKLKQGGSNTALFLFRFIRHQSANRKRKFGNASLEEKGQEKPSYGGFMH